MSAPPRLLMKVVGSAVAACVGAVTGVIGMLLFGWEDWLTCLFMIGIFVVPVWLLVLLPLHVLLPGSSRFWRPGISAGFGGVSGAILLAGYFALWGGEGFQLIWFFLPFGVIVGGVTCFVGSAMARCYGGTQTTYTKELR